MKTENLTWFEALYHVRAGKSVTRTEWENIEKRVYFDVDGDGTPDVIDVDSDQARGQHRNYGMKLDANSLFFLQCIYLAAPGQEPQKAYHPCQADYVATDWFVIS